MLFKSTDILKKYAALTGDLNFDDISATIKLVEDDIIIPILGTEQYESLNTAYNTAALENSLSDPVKTLLEKCRLVIGPYVCVHFAPKADIQLGAGGMRRAETNNVKTAYQEQRLAFIEANEAQGEKAIESLLKTLEENKDQYTEWADSDEFKELRSLFISTGTEFKKLFQSHTPYRNYYAIRTHMKDVEELTIRDFLGNEMFDDLKEISMEAEPEFTDEQALLMAKLKKVIAYLGIANALPFLSFRIDSNGITLMNKNTAKSDAVGKRESANGTDIEYLVKKISGTARTYLQQATDYIKKNQTAFSNWKGFASKPAVGPSPNAGLTGMYGLM